jgi:hypothetical protein
MAMKSRQNGHASQDEDMTVINLVRGLSRLTVNEATSMSRSALIQLMSGELPPLDIDKECRYPKVLTLDHYNNLYMRESVAARVVSLYPDESWAMEPEIYETEDLDEDTEFEKDWEALNNELHLLSALQYADEVSGIGNFGIVLLGFDDANSGDPSKPVSGVRDDGTRDARFSDVKLLYARPFSQVYCKITDWETNVSNPRYAQPTMYQIGLVNPSVLSARADITIPPPENWTKIHWSRIIHICDNRQFSNVWGIPRQQQVFNNLWNVRKILGSDAQGYWSFGFPGISVETQPGVDAPDFDKAKTKEEIRKYIEGMQRYIALEGMSAKSLNGSVPDPSPHLNAQLMAICIKLGSPLRVFLGTEEAKLASSQDMRTWNKRLFRRQTTYNTPFLIKELLNRLFLVGALTRPAKGPFVKWADLNAPTDNDRATTAQKITDALLKYIAGNVFTIMGPREYLTLVLGLPLKQVNSIINVVGATKMMSNLNKIAAAAQKAQASPTGRIKKAKITDGAGPSR